jgi:hypothetical protein
MRMTNRTGSVLLALVMAGGAATTLSAQNFGLPLFTNPRVATGVRIHADAGRNTQSVNNVDRTVVQGGLSFAIGPVGINAAVAGNLTDIKNCSGGGANCNVNTVVSAGALAMIKVYGGGRRNVSVSAFGGASTDLNALDYLGVEQPKQLTIPFGVSIGYRIPLGLASLNVWAAPRMNMIKFVNCAAGDTTCDTSETKFRWAVGADLPIFRILSARVAYDSGKIGTETVNFIGVGASIGFGGMR